MNRKTIIVLITHIIGCLAGLFTGLIGLAEIFGDVFTEIGQLPIYIAIPICFSGMFTFVSVFMHGVDSKTWDKIKE